MAPSGSEGRLGDPAIPRTLVSLEVPPKRELAFFLVQTES